ncbi:hypothetical protein [Paenibacillus hemerocallicola]|nr:hypothetical protein [Paenibacillus hemerocallicola]
MLLISFAKIAGVTPSVKSITINAPLYSNVFRVIRQDRSASTHQ